VINPNVPEDIQFGTVRILRPVGCDKTSLSLTALDFHTRELAEETYIEFNGKMISCNGIEITSRGELILRVHQDGYKFIDADKEPTNA
jgi:hypothetical protein